MSLKGAGLIQFRENKVLIEELKTKGYDRKRIYIKLTEHIGISYTQFTRIWKKEFNENTQNKSPDIKTQRTIQNPSPKQTKNTPTTPLQKDIFRQPQKVLHNPSMTDERRKELFGE